MGKKRNPNESPGYGHYNPGYVYHPDKGYVPVDSAAGPLPHVDIPGDPTGGSAPTAGLGREIATTAGGVAAAEAGLGGAKAGIKGLGRAAQKFAKVPKLSGFLKGAGVIGGALLAVQLLDKLHEMSVGEKNRKQQEWRDQEISGQGIRSMLQDSAAGQADFSHVLRSQQQASSMGAMGNALGGMADNDVEGLIAGKEDAIRSMALASKPSILDLLGIRS